MRKISILISACALFILGCGAAAINATEYKLPNNLNKNILTTYNNGTAVLLYTYPAENKDSEQHADWDNYLNEFRSRTTNSFMTVEVTPAELSYLIEDTKPLQAFSLFIKKGYPSFGYDGVIVEPQVYLSVESSYQNKALTPELVSFSPSKVKLKTK